MSTIVLIGFMGAGKTTVSKKLSEVLNKPLIDMDVHLVGNLGCSINDYFETYGESAFRMQETALLKSCLQEEGVIATGGGVVLQEENQKLLKDHLVVYLKADVDQLIDRIRQDKKQIRPLAESSKDEELRQLFFLREKHYETLADITIDTNSKTPEEVVAEIVKQVESL
ncbi:hypothetical protein A5844_001451 [Enterococcus sp. 10A9_DIV0425]|uniref:Shikimate kinase n=1 Tax=Candidatus Enterococcus wittei TaxID=1987383 RepID=A0A242K2P6_9ENTE|nr:shikimate kinase [Enterococcus sp. 10A9_DIV0425]OTP11316.1 hypothetical protein A5844_001451 [Enterococcus sp. 10A9_DIV0425]THE13727.1 shikimate kinase [Enterococcus hirae]